MLFTEHVRCVMFEILYDGKVECSKIGSIVSKPRICQTVHLVPKSLRQQCLTVFARIQVLCMLTQWTYEGGYCIRCDKRPLKIRNKGLLLE